jgi:hypothetical protein
MFEDKDSTHLIKLAKSIGIIVSKVNNDGETDEDVRNDLTTKLLESLDTNKLLNPNETFVFRHVLRNAQLELFSNPRKKILLDNIQKNQMLSMLDKKLVYVTQKDAHIRVRIDRSHLAKLNAYIMDNFRKFEANLHSRLERNINTFINTVVESNEINENNSLLIRRLLNLINEHGIELMKFDEFVGILDDEFLSKDEKKLMYEQKEILDYFINLLSEEYRRSFSSERTWLSVNLLARINDAINNKVFPYIMDENKKVSV